MSSSVDSRDLGHHQLASRGERLVRRPPVPEYLQEHFARSAAPAGSSAGVEGYIPLCIAENKMVWDLLQPRMARHCNLPHRAICYDAMIGSLTFREQLARFMTRTFLGRPVTPQQLAVLAGAGSVLELLLYVLAEPGDGVLVPTPSYAGFWMDLQTRDELSIVPVHTSSEQGFRLSPELLEQSLAAADRPVKALLLTSPDNPKGTVYPRDELAALLEWAEQHRLHVVADEVYALSVYGQTSFTSCASLRPTLGERLHLVWAFSKDFGASGLRCGVLVSENRAVLQAIDVLSYWACCSGETQHLLGSLIDDDPWVDSFLRESQRRLGQAYQAVTAALTAAGIVFLPAEAGFFLLLDLRRFLPAVTWEEEDRLWRRLLECANVNLTPGAACHIGEPGFMRLCFASVPTEEVIVGIKRIARILQLSSP